MKNITFYVNNVCKCESRNNKDEVDSASANLIDIKDKNKSDKEWKPTSSISVYIVGDGAETGLQFGKKYKVTFTEVK